MITSLRGELIAKNPTYAEIECHGVGYGVHISLTTYGELPEKGPCRLLVDYLVSVDVRSGASDHRLFGFTTDQERELFRKLVQVQGVSSTIAMSMLGALRPSELSSSIIGGDISALKGIKGIGPKLAQRIITELASKLTGQDLTAGDSIIQGSSNTLKAEALSALISLGMDRTKAERALQGVLNERKGEEVGLEDLIRTTLKNLN
jgi:Holliday junction DNA helicase RuvA